jgi:hypothetical protein
MAHSCNPSYLGGRDQEDHGSKPALSKQLLRPHLKKSNHKKKRAGGVAQAVRVPA